MILDSTGGGRDSPLLFAPNNESEEWIKDWKKAKAKGLFPSNFRMERFIEASYPTTLQASSTFL